MSNNITINVNDVATPFHTALSVNDYIVKAAISGRFIIVVNGQLLSKSAYSTTLLNDGDRLDIISPITGG